MSLTFDSISDFRVVVTSESSSASNIERLKQIVSIEGLGILVAGQERDAIIIRCQKSVAEQLKGFSWVTSVEKYDCYLKLVGF